MADGADIPLPDTGRPGRAGPDLRQPPRPVRGARPQRRQQGRHPQPPARGRRERARRPGPARQRDDPQPLRRRPRRSATAPARCSTPSRSWRSSPTRWPPTTSWCARSSRTWPASRRRWSPSGSRSSGRCAAVADSVGTVKTFVHDNRQGAGHRRREAHPGDEDHQLRAGQHRHRARRRAGGDQQPDARLTTRSPAPSARGSASRASCGTPTASCARSSSSPDCRRRARTWPARSSSSCSSRSRNNIPAIPSRQAGRRRRRRRKRQPARTWPAASAASGEPDPGAVRRRRHADAAGLLGGGA